MIPRSAGVSCSVRCGCTREKCKSRNVEQSSVPETIEEESSEEELLENVADKENQVVNIGPMMKHKRIVAPSQTVREQADMEVSFSTKKVLDQFKAPKTKAKSKRVVINSPNVTLDCSVLAPKQDNAKSVFSPSVYQKFKTNHINAGGSN